MVGREADDALNVDPVVGGDLGQGVAESDAVDDPVDAGDEDLLPCDDEVGVIAHLRVVPEDVLLAYAVGLGDGGDGIPRLDRVCVVRGLGLRGWLGSGFGRWLWGRLRRGLRCRCWLGGRLRLLPGPDAGECGQYDWGREVAGGARGRGLAGDAGSRRRGFSPQAPAQGDARGDDG